MNTNIPLGVPAYGASFFGYASELSFIWKNLVAGRDVALVGPRRSGKTSLLRRVYDGGPERGFAAIFLDASTVRNPSEFVSLLYKGVMALPTTELALKNATRRLKSGLQGVSSVEVSLSGLKFAFDTDAPKEWDWKIAGEILLESIANSEEKIVFVIDEFGYLLTRVEDKDISDLLTWFRSVRERISTPQSIRWLISTEHSADYRLKSLGSRYAFQDFTRVNIAPFDHKTASQYLYVLLNSIGLRAPEELRNKIIDELGITYPYYINLFVNALQSILRETETEVNQESITKAFDDLASDRSRSFLSLRHMILSQVGKDRARMAEDILAHLGRTTQGVTKQELLAELSSEAQQPVDLAEIEELMDILLGEGIVHIREGRFHMQSGIVRKHFAARLA